MAMPWGMTWGGCWRDPTPCPHSTAAQVTDGSQYHVLLIITDGVISDMMQTKEAIVTVSGHMPPAQAPVTALVLLGRSEPTAAALPPHRPLRCPCPSSSWEWGRLSSRVSGMGWGQGGARGALARRV